jgi:hypothetical protein
MLGGVQRFDYQPAHMRVGDRVHDASLPSNANGYSHSDKINSTDSTNSTG